MLCIEAVEDRADRRAAARRRVVVINQQGAAAPLLANQYVPAMNPVAPPQQMLVTVPPGMQPGQAMQVQFPGGVIGQVQIPPGFTQGMSFAALPPQVQPQVVKPLMQPPMQPGMQPQVQPQAQMQIQQHVPFAAPCAPEVPDAST